MDDDDMQFIKAIMADLLNIRIYIGHSETGIITGLSNCKSPKTQNESWGLRYEGFTLRNTALYRLILATHLNKKKGTIKYICRKKWHFPCVPFRSVPSKSKALDV